MFSTSISGVLFALLTILQTLTAVLELPTSSARALSRPAGWCRPRPGRDDKRRGLPPLAARSSTTFFLSNFLFLLPFLTLTYLSTSICLIDEFCASVVDGRPVPSSDETVSSFVVLTPSWTDGTTGISDRHHYRKRSRQEKIQTRLPLLPRLVIVIFSLRGQNKV